MADARQSALFANEHKRGFKLLFQDDGYGDGYITLSVAIPHPRTLRRNVVRRFFLLRNHLHRAMWPASPVACIVVVVVVIAVVVSADSDSWWRSGWLAQFLWFFDRYSPVRQYWSVDVRVGWWAAWAAFCLFLLLMAVQRFFLRALLSFHGWIYLKPGEERGCVVTAWGGLVRALSGRSPLLFDIQNCLPHLPVPGLRQTCDRYLRSVEPLLSAEELAEAGRQAADFCTSGEGAKLQLYLQFKAWLWSPNYVTDWWEQYVYLRGRSPLVINNNYYILDNPFVPPACRGRQAARAASVAHQFLRFKRRVDHEDLEPVVLKGVAPLCMAQYARMFGCTRVPGRNDDELLVRGRSARHFVVLCGGGFYVVHGHRRDPRTGMDSAGAPPPTVEELEEQFRAIRRDADLRLEKLGEGRRKMLHTGKSGHAMMGGSGLLRGGRGGGGGGGGGGGTGTGTGGTGTGGGAMMRRVVSVPEEMSLGGSGVATRRSEAARARGESLRRWAANNHRDDHGDAGGGATGRGARRRRGASRGGRRHGSRGVDGSRRGSSSSTDDGIGPNDDDDDEEEEEEEEEQRSSLVVHGLQPMVRMVTVGASGAGGMGEDSSTAGMAMASNGAGGGGGRGGGGGGSASSSGRGSGGDAGGSVASGQRSLARGELNDDLQVATDSLSSPSAPGAAGAAGAHGGTASSPRSPRHQPYFVTMRDRIEWQPRHRRRGRGGSEDEDGFLDEDGLVPEAYIPSLTGDSRTRWAEARERYFSEGTNKASLDMVETAAFIVSLDDGEAPADNAARGRALIHGNGRDRWFDKSLNLVVFRDGRCGLNVEHSWSDAPVAAHLWEWALTGEIIMMEEERKRKKRKEEEEAAAAAATAAAAAARGSGAVVAAATAATAAAAAAARGLVGGGGGGDDDGIVSRAFHRGGFPRSSSSSSSSSRGSRGRRSGKGGGAAKLPPPPRLHWYLPGRARRSCKQAYAAVRELVEDFDLCVQSHDAYGKGFIKGCHLSPDAYIQLALQLAYYRDAEGQFALTYEASMSRLFHLGRTETVRSLSPESVAFVEAMVAYTKAAADGGRGGGGGGGVFRDDVDGDDHDDHEDRVSTRKPRDSATGSVVALRRVAKAKLRVAAERHVRLYKDAMCGKGVDRHLFALYIVSKGMDIDSPFLENALSMPWKLSTSQTPPQQTDRRKHLPAEIRAQFVPPGGGYGPVHDDGYGVSYMVAGEHALFFHVSAKNRSNKTDARRLGEGIVQALADMRSLWADAGSED